MSALIGLAFSEEALSDLELIPHKFRAQIVKKAKALQLDPHPPTSEPLEGVESKSGGRVFRVRAGDYRILYVVQSNPTCVVILTVGDRKEVYKKMKNKPKEPDILKMDAGEFDRMMQRALGVSPKAAEKSKSEGKKPKPKKRNG